MLGKACSAWLKPTEVILFMLLLAFSLNAFAQTSPPPQTGQNAVMNSATQTQSSPAFVDALPLLTTDICVTIQGILSNWNLSNSNGLVIDARGIGPGQTIGCSVNPWANVTTDYTNTILLPAATILLQTKWVMTNSTRIIGVGSGLSSSSGVTMLKACAGSTSCGGNTLSGDMVDMGSLSICGLQCQAVVIEHLQLDGNSVTGVNGILNQYAQELSYANDIKLTNFKGFGLELNTKAYNSGPYTRIYYSGSGPCANILATANTRGIHGFTCITSSNPAVYVDSPNQSLEDVTIQGTSSSAQDGILIGSQSCSPGPCAPSSVFINISGSGTNLTNVIHICGASGPCSFNPSNAADISITGVTRGSGTTNVIRDDLTGTTLTDSQVGLYVVGEQIPSIGTATSNPTSGYSRFTTSPSVPTWFVGTSPATPCKAGSLYSCTSGCAKTLYACTNSGGGSAWVGIK